MRFISLLLLALALAAPAGAITLAEAQAEAEAWMAPRLAGFTTEFEACVATKDLSDCHPTWSSDTLPNTAPADPSLATVTNNDPGIWQTGCGGCYVDEQRWVDAGVDVPLTSPVMLRGNSYENNTGIGVQVSIRIQYDGVIWQKGYGLFGPAPDEDWTDQSTTP